jgi:hypothetical protein
MKEEKWIAFMTNITGRSRPPADPYRPESLDRVSGAAGRMERTAWVGRGSAARRTTRENGGGRACWLAQAGTWGRGGTRTAREAGMGRHGGKHVSHLHAGHHRAIGRKSAFRPYWHARLQ